MELAYTKVGDYYIPDLALDDDTEYEIGVYGRMREKFRLCRKFCVKGDKL